MSLDGPTWWRRSGLLPPYKRGVPIRRTVGVCYWEMPWATELDLLAAEAVAAAVLEPVAQGGK